MGKIRTTKSVKSVGNDEFEFTIEEKETKVEKETISKLDEEIAKLEAKIAEKNAKKDAINNLSE